MKITEHSSCTCKNCGCSHHCDGECKDCRNDVCHNCDCDHCKKTIDQHWSWQDSGIELGF